jgi:hypothetical protein
MEIASQLVKIKHLWSQLFMESNHALMKRVGQLVKQSLMDLANQPVYSRTFGASQ